jgi:3-deoxy-D-manno-octulosonic-acid transferase
MLRRVTHFFVQNQESLELLYKRSIPQVSVTGDTRFDRVYQNSLNTKSLPEIEVFKGKKKLLIAGSTWGQDEKIILNLFQKIRNEFQLVIVPHEISENRINSLVQKAGTAAIRYSKWDKKTTTYEILVIDNIGMLSSLYKYGEVAYIGGGFGNGIHNILEAVVYGIPVFFGPKYKKFREAKELVHWKSAFSCRNENELTAQFNDVMNNPARLDKIKDINNRYISNNKGSTELIINFLRINS